MVKKENQGIHVFFFFQAGFLNVGNMGQEPKVFAVVPEVGVGHPFLYASVGIGNQDLDESHDILRFFAVMERVKAQAVFHVLNVEYFDLVAVPFQHFPRIPEKAAVRVCDDIACVHLHDVGQRVKAGFPGSGRADNKGMAV